MGKERLYTTLARYTDLFYRKIKDYDKEVRFLRSIARHVPDKTALDVCCGTGPHAKRLVAHGWAVTCLDLNKEMLARARRNVPGATFVQADLRHFRLPQRFSLIIVMFNSINYVMTYAGLERALRTYHAHLKDGGLLVFDTLFTQQHFTDGYFGVQQFGEGALQIARIDKARRTGDLGLVDITYVIHDGNKKRVINTTNKVLLLDPRKVIRLMRRVGFDATRYYDFDTTKKTARTVIFAGKKTALRRP